jgi:hypothetical protein
MYPIDCRSVLLQAFSWNVSPNIFHTCATNSVTFFAIGRYVRALCLLNTVFCQFYWIQYSVNFIEYSILSTLLNTVFCPLYWIQYSVNFIEYSILSTLLNTVFCHFIEYSILSTLLNTVFCQLYWIQYSVNFIEYSILWTLFWLPFKEISWKIHTSLFERMNCTNCMFGCDQSANKGALRTNQVTFSLYLGCHLEDFPESSYLELCIHMQGTTDVFMAWRWCEGGMGEFYGMEVMWWWYGRVLWHGGDVMVVW